MSETKALEIAEITQELTIEKQQAFDDTVKYLLRLAHEIDDIGNVASRLIAERKNAYNWKLEQTKAFLREYALEHMRRDGNGEIKGRNYKSLTAGGGIFFRARPQKLTIDKEKLGWLKKEFLLNYLDDSLANELITEKIAFEVPNEKALICALKVVVKNRAEEKLEELKAETTLSEQEEKFALEAFVNQGEEEIFNNEVIQLSPKEEFHTMTVGSSKGWTGKDTKMQFIKALKGTLEPEKEEQDEVTALLEELE